jgi:DNA-binding NarL/FixJ family response regulator
MEVAMIRVVLVDDDPSVRRGVRLRLELEPDICVVGECANATGLSSNGCLAAADAVVLDIELPGHGGGIAATARIRQSLPRVPVIVLTLHDDERTRADALAAGAAAFVSKTSDDSVLVHAIRQAAAAAANPSAGAGT